MLLIKKSIEWKKNNPGIRKHGKESPAYKHGKYLKTNCIDCKKPINRGYQRCHSCSMKFIHKTSKKMIDYINNLSGKNNPMFGKKRPENSGKNNCNWKEKIKINCSYCNKTLELHSHRTKKTKNFFCNEEHFYLWKTKNLLGKNNPNWKGGVSFDPYGVEFNSSLKEQIRFRDGYKCKICGCPQIENGKSLSIHHIDYNKLNNNFNNLISLCKNCHVKTNGNRTYWENYLKELINGYFTPLQVC